MSSAKTAVSKRSATTTPTVRPSKSTSTTTQNDVSTNPCKLGAQDTVLATSTVKRKADPYYNSTISSTTPGTHDGRKVGENKLLSKTNKTTRYIPFLWPDGRFSPD